MSNDNESNAIQQPIKTCPATGYQPLTVCTPVTITPFMNTVLPPFFVVVKQL